jgi:tetratricopeptide (TPR) repeat protein
LNRFFALGLEAVHRYEGTINQFLGDGFMALFGAPIAHEDHARRAVLAALALQRSLTDQQAELGAPHGVACAVRLGLNSGLVVVGSIGDNLRMDYSAIGDTTNLAARLQQLAEPGTILISESTSRLVHDSMRLEALPPVDVKGKTAPVTPYKVLGARPRRSPIVSRGERTFSQFVGRERELAVLEELLGQVESGQGQVVGLVTEAGGGKSRLLYEFRQRLAGKRLTYLEGRCLSYGGSIPYHPIIDLVRNNCGITETDSPEAMAEKVSFALQEVGMEVAASVPYLLQLLGVQEGTEAIAAFTPEAIKAQTFATLQQWSVKGSQRCPLIVEVEDLHWVDKTSEEYLAALVESLAGAPIMLLTTYRRGYHPPWLDKSYATQLSLRSLAAPEALSVVRSTSQQNTIPAHIEQMIVEKAEGNPFFLEELTRAVLEHADFETAVAVPDTIQGVLMARIDRLPEESKRLLQTAAVLGREFSPRLLAAIWDSTGALESLLLGLKQLEFLYERTGAAEPVVVFKHALTQEVAYGSLLTTRRQALHAAAGHGLETLAQERLAERYEELAHHCTMGEVWDKAFVYLVRSGDKARQAYANQEALAFYTQALEVSQRLTPTVEAAQLLPVYEGRGRVWFLLRKLDAAIADFQRMRQMAHASRQSHQEGASLCHLAHAHYERYSADDLLLAEQYAQEAQQLAQRLGDTEILARSLASLGLIALWRGHMADADRQLAAALQISRRQGDKDALVTTLWTLSIKAYWQGQFQPAIRLAQEGLSVARDVHDGFHELYCLVFLCLAQWSWGDYQQAFRVAHEVLTKAHERQNMFFLGRIQNQLGWFHRELGAVSRAAELGHESIDLGHTHGIPIVEISALVNLGLDYLALGQQAHALSYLAPTLDRVVREASGVHRWRWKIRLLIGLAELSYTTGAYDQALRYVEEGITEAQATSSQKYLALGRAWRGKIAGKLGDAATAGTELQRAFTLAEQLHSPSFFYPIAYDLGHWYESTGKERQAAALYGTARATVEHMAAAIEDDTLRATFLHSALVQTITASATRLGG